MEGLGRQSKKTKGFTLVELLLVIGIIGFLSVSVLSIRYTRDRVMLSALNLSTQLQSARMKAIKTNHNYLVEFDLGNNRYRIVSDDNNNLVPDVDESAEEWTSLPQTVEFLDPGGGDDITVDPPGASDDMAAFNSRGLLQSANLPGYIYVGYDERGIYRRVLVNLTGYTKVQRWDGTQWEGIIE